MITFRIRSLMWFAAGAAIALLLAAMFVGVRTQAAPGDDETTFVPITPCRLFDTRPAPNTVGARSSALAAADTHIQQVTGAQGDCTLPDDVTAVSLNVTIANPTSQSFLSVFPSDADRPTASNLNWVAGQSATPNKVDVKLSSDGRISLYNNRGTVNVFGDVVGYYTTSGLADLQTQIDALGARIEASKVRTDVYNGRSLQYRNGSPSALNGCEWNSAGIQYLPLTLPLGAELLAVEAEVLDTFSTSYQVSLVRSSFNPEPIDRYEADMLASATGGELNIVLVTHDLTPATTEFVDDREVFAVRFEPQFSGGVGSDHTLCRVSVTYREV